MQQLFQHYLQKRCNSLNKYTLQHSANNYRVFRNLCLVQRELCDNKFDIIETAGENVDKDQL